MATTKKKSPARSTAKSKAKPTRRSTAKRRSKKSTTRRSGAITRWLVVLLLVIILVLAGIIYLLIADSDTPTAVTSQPIETVPSVEDRDTVKPVPTPQVTGRYVVSSVTMTKEITAHVSAYIIEVQKNGTTFARVEHESAPVTSTNVEQRGNNVYLVVYAIDQAGGEFFDETYRYQLFADGRYTLIE